ncbi:MAG: hypothetical protein HY911_12310 [Desulfobacterales bacterium]|nr:hypothetical protein [Desulfobacterales bacterium]
MKTKVTVMLMVLAWGLIIGAAPAWAKETAYNYLIAYSYKDKVVYHSTIFTNKVKGESSSEEEFAIDTASILKLESAFQKHLAQSLKVNSPDLTVSARMAYKSQEIAKKRMDNEIGDFRFKGFEIKDAGFKYSD